jgi:hypothetical protein
MLLPAASLSPSPALESIAILRAKIIEQRASEARDVTAQMQTDLQEGVKREAPRFRKPSN